MLSDIGLETLSTEEGCPTEDKIELMFTLTSKLLGSADIELEIPVQPSEDESFFEGV